MTSFLNFTLSLAYEAKQLIFFFVYWFCLQQTSQFSYWFNNLPWCSVTVRRCSSSFPISLAFISCSCLGPDLQNVAGEMVPERIPAWSRYQSKSFWGCFCCGCLYRPFIRLAGAAVPTWTIFFLNGCRLLSNILFSFIELTVRFSLKPVGAEDSIRCRCDVQPLLVPGQTRQPRGAIPSTRLAVGPCCRLLQAVISLRCQGPLTPLRWDGEYLLHCCSLHGLKVMLFVSWIYW